MIANTFYIYSRKKKDYVPLEENDLFKIYSCGPTVHDYAHIGNFRYFTMVDVFKKVLLFSGYNVKHVMNITDIDDKIIVKCKKAKKGLKEFTDKYTDAFLKHLDLLNIKRFDVIPKATDHINEMVTMIDQLMSSGYAYKAKDNCVYFDVESYSDYGYFSDHIGQDGDEGRSGRVESNTNKKNSNDFVLWKSYDEERDSGIYWDSPFGKGRPGWHIECSAMAIKHLGQTLDCHTGGIDLMFPHHENEIAQSQCYTQKKFVKNWFHVEHLLINNHKMSKSLGNFMTLDDYVSSGYDPLVLRFYFLQNHYRTQMNFSDEGISAAKASLDFIQNTLRRINDHTTSDGNNSLTKEDIDKVSKSVTSELVNDLNTHKAITHIHSWLSSINHLVDDKLLTSSDVHLINQTMEQFDSVFSCLIPVDEVIPANIIELVEKRKLAREAKKWSESDTIRNEVFTLGYIIEDLPGGKSVARKINDA